MYQNDTRTKPASKVACDHLMSCLNSFLPPFQGHLIAHNESNKKESFSLWPCNRFAKFNPLRIYVLAKEIILSMCLIILVIPQDFINLMVGFDIFAPNTEKLCAQNSWSVVDYFGKFSHFGSLVRWRPSQRSKAQSSEVRRTGGEPQINCAVLQSKKELFRRAAL